MEECQGEAVSETPPGDGPMEECQGAAVSGTLPGALSDTLPGALSDTLPGALSDTLPGNGDRDQPVKEPTLGSFSGGGTPVPPPPACDSARVLPPGEPMRAAQITLRFLVPVVCSEDSQRMYT